MPRKLPPNQNKMTLQSHTPIADYLEAKQQRNDRLWKLRKGVLYTTYNGSEISAEEFDKLHPVKCSLSFISSPENSDKTKNYLM